MNGNLIPAFGAAKVTDEAKIEVIAHNNAELFLVDVLV